MLKSKRIKIDLDAASSSSSAGTQKMSTSDEHHADQEATGPCKEAHGATPKVDKRTLFAKSLTNFKEAVQWRAFVDRSLLIRELLLNSDDNFVFVFAPSRFGKSMNLDMVKCFVEIPEDVENTENLEDLKNSANYKAFCRKGPDGKSYGKRCKILDNQTVVKEHFGRHPVVYLNFKGIDVFSTETLEEGVRAVIHEAYLSHTYLMCSNSLADNPYMVELMKENCEKWCDVQKHTTLNAVLGLKNLIECLYKHHHKKKVYLLVDECDAPTVNALLACQTEKEVRGVCYTITHLLGEVLKGPIIDHYLEGALVTGVSYLSSCGISNINNVTICKYLQDKRFVDYYGLTEEELTSLLADLFPEETKRKSVKEEIIHYYNGYYYKGKTDKPIYCLWSVLHYVQLCLHGEVDKIENHYFWVRCTMLCELGYVLKNNAIIGEIIKIMGGENYTFSPVLSLSVDARDLAVLFSGGQIELNEFFTFLMDQGYLTHVGAVQSDKVTVKIPNKEVLGAYNAMFSNFCIKICGLNESTMENCADVFKQTHPDADTDQFEEMLSTFYEKFKQLMSEISGQVDMNEHTIQAVMYTTMLKADFKECALKKIVETEGPNNVKKIGKIDLWMKHVNNFAIIWKFKHNKGGDIKSTKASALHALKKILGQAQNKQVPHVKILEQQNINKYLLIGLCVGEALQPAVCYLRNTQDIGSCVYLPEKQY